MTRMTVLPCQVNALDPSPARQVRSLNGRWAFLPDPDRRLTPARAARAAARLTLRVPGCWEAQGVGGAGRLTRTPYSTSRVRGTYRGLGWYRVRFDYRLPSPDRRIWLKVGVVHGTAAITLNGRPIGALSRTIGAYRFDITAACRPAGNTLLIAADNDLASCGGAGDALGVLGGLTQGVELEQTAPVWIAAVRVDGVPAARAATGWVELRGDEPRVGAGGYTLRLMARCLGRGADRQVLEIPVAPAARGDGVRVPFRLPVPRPRLWAPDTPALYRLTVQLCRGREVLDESTVRFGFRSLAVRGTRMLLNGQPLFLAGCGTMTHTPETVGPTTDRAALRREFRRLKAYGFIWVRYHTETPYDELFDAADEVGVLVQPENRPYGGVSNEPVKAGGEIEFDPGLAREGDAEAQWHIRETARIHAHFGNHPSLAVYCMGNEYYDHKLATRKRWVAAVKAMDATRLAISADGQYHYHPGADDFVAGFHNDAASLRAAPVVLHEFLNLPTLPDAREARRFRGGLRVPDALRAYRAWARRAGLSGARLRRLSVASHRLQEAHLKYGIEKARAIPGIQGYGLWRYRDFWQYPTRIGLVTVHGADKDHAPAAVRVYNGQTVLIANLAYAGMEVAGMPVGGDLEVYGADRVEGVCRCGQRVALTLFLAHAGAPAVRDGVLDWKVSAAGRVIAAGRLRAIAGAPGAIARCGTIRWTMPGGNAPCAVRVEAALRAATVSAANTWSLWAFPRAAAAARPDLAVCGAVADHFPVAPAVRRVPDAGALAGQEARTILLTDSLARPGLAGWVARGGRVLLVSARDYPSQPIVAHPGWWSAGPHRFTGAVLERHPVFARWPGAGVADWPFFRLFMAKEACEFPERLAGRLLPTTRVPVFERRPFPHDAIAYGVRGVQEGWTTPRQHFQFGWMPYLFEVRSGAGRVFGCMLRLRNDPLVGHWLAQSILAYLRSPAFRPKARAAWPRLCPPRPRDAALNGVVYWRRNEGADQVFLHGVRRSAGYRLAAILTPHPAQRTVHLGSFGEADAPLAAILDLGVHWRVGQVRIRRAAGGGARSVRVSLGADTDAWTVLGVQRFPAGAAARLTFAGRGLEARWVRLECLDPCKEKSPPRRLALGQVAVMPAGLPDA